MSMHNEVTRCEIVPGWYLVTGEWNGNSWGLTHGNHPTFMFDWYPICDLTDAELESIDQTPDPATEDRWNNFNKLLEMFYNSLVCDTMTGYSIVSAGIVAGYNEHADGDFRYWLLCRIAAKFQELNIQL